MEAIRQAVEGKIVSILPIILSFQDYSSIPSSFTLQPFQGQRLADRINQEVIVMGAVS